MRIQQLAEFSDDQPQSNIDTLRLISRKISANRYLITDLRKRISYVFGRHVIHRNNDGLPWFSSELYGSRPEVKSKYMDLGTYQATYSQRVFGLIDAGPEGNATINKMKLWLARCKYLTQKLKTLKQEKVRIIDVMRVNGERKRWNENTNI